VSIVPCNSTSFYEKYTKCKVYFRASMVKMEGRRFLPLPNFNVVDSCSVVMIFQTSHSSHKFVPYIRYEFAYLELFAPTSW
jgi:hypothetical protein